MELAQLKGSLALFRETTTAYARHEFAHAHAISVSRDGGSRGFSPRAWLAAAAVLALAVVLPFAMNRPQPVERPTMADTESAVPTSGVAARATVSDEALLEEVDQDITSTVPSAMRPLADPTTERSMMNQKEN
jgi:hypothetical protein